MLNTVLNLLNTLRRINYELINYLQLSRSSLGNWVLGYELASNVAKHGTYLISTEVRVFTMYETLEL